MPEGRQGKERRQGKRVKSYHWRMRELERREGARGEGGREIGGEVDGRKIRELG